MKYLLDTCLFVSPQLPTLKIDQPLIVIGMRRDVPGSRKLRGFVVNEQQRAYLRGRRFCFHCNEAMFLRKERDELKRHGCFLEGLVSGGLVPETPEQLHFISVARGEMEAGTMYEFLWLKLARLRKEHAELRQRMERAMMEAEESRIKAREAEEARLKSLGLVSPRSNSSYAEWCEREFGIPEYIT